jgi:hypothetical protein
MNVTTQEHHLLLALGVHLLCEVRQALLKLRALLLEEIR